MEERIARGGSISYFICMRKIGIRALKNDLSKYIRAAAGGETILVTNRGHVVAEIRPPQAADDKFDNRLDSSGAAFTLQG